MKKKVKVPGIKVCGMRDSDNIRHLVKLHPDFIGFILYPPSRRYLGDNYKLTAAIPKKVKRVGVFVNALLDEIVQWTGRLNLDYAQLHGNESIEYCLELKGMGIRVIKAFGIDSSFDFSRLSDYASCIDFFLFDSISQEHGGTGMHFDWSVLDKYQLSVPFFLGGGIEPDDSRNLKQLQHKALFAFDLNSRFEITPGLKDVDLVRQFVNELRADTN